MPWQDNSNHSLENFGKWAIGPTAHQRRVTNDKLQHEHEMGLYQTQRNTLAWQKYHIKQDIDAFKIKLIETKDKLRDRNEELAMCDHEIYNYEMDLMELKETRRVSYQNMQMKLLHTLVQ